MGSRGMKRKLALALLLATLALPLGARAELPTPDKQSLDYYLVAHKRYSPATGEPLERWEGALVTALGTSTPDRVADRLAVPFGLPPAQMRELVRLWLFAHANVTSMDR